MLVATLSETSKSLELFRLALLLIEKGNEVESDPLTEHFNTVLQEAKKIIENTDNITAEVAPQSIKLAWFLKIHPELIDTLTNVNSIGEVDKECAQTILRKLDNSVLDEVDVFAS